MTPDIPAPMIVGEPTLEVAFAPVGITRAVPVTVSLPTAVLACKSSPSITTVTFDVVATVSLPTAPVADTPEGVAMALSSKSKERPKVVLKPSKFSSSLVLKSSTKAPTGTVDTILVPAFS